MRIVAIDPGPKESAFVSWDTETSTIESFGNVQNAEIIGRLQVWSADVDTENQIWIEGMQSYGTVMGASTIETLIWIGRFIQVREWYGDSARLVLRTKIKTHICGNTAAKDGHVREALIARLGPPGKKSAPGPTYGITSHIWQALAIAVYAHDKANGDAR